MLQPTGFGMPIAVDRLQERLTFHIVVATSACGRLGSEQPRFTGSCSCSVLDVGVDAVLICALASGEICSANGGSADFLPNKLF